MKEKDREIKFYIGTLIGFAGAVLLLTLGLLWFWFYIRDYEKCLPNSLVEQVMSNYSGSDLYYYENSSPGSEQKHFRIQNGDRKVADVTLVPAKRKSAFGRIQYTVGEVKEAEKPEPMVPAEGESVWDEVLREQAEAEEEASGSGEEEKPSLPVSEEEKEQVAAVAEQFIRAYAPFATFKNTGAYRAPVLELLKSDTELYEKLGSYVNGWGQNVSSYDFSDMNVENVIKTSETDYECDATCNFIIKNADWGISRPYELSYHLDLSSEDGQYRISGME